VTHHARHKWLSREDKYLSAGYPLAQLLDLIPADDVALHRVLRGSGIFPDDLMNPACLISVRQVHAVVRNMRALYERHETAQRWGNRLWPGYSGALSQALAASPDLGAFLKTLSLGRFFLCPGVSPVVRLNGDYCLLYWRHLSGSDRSACDYLAAVFSTALMAVLRENCEDIADRVLCLVRSRERSLADPLRVYLGCPVVTGAAADALIFPRSLLNQPWQNGSRRLFESGLSQAVSRLNALPAATFPEAVAAFFDEQLPQSVSLQSVAGHFDLSPASVKRYLRGEGLGLQDLQDAARLRFSLESMLIDESSNEDIARTLGMGDGTNFRRAFRRWTGQYPGELRERLKGVTLPRTERSRSDHTGSELLPGALPEYGR
jgi:AraC-like DNA-binding protein